MLSKRYLNDGKPCLKLNSIQLDQKLIIQANMDSGRYDFEEISCVVCGEKEITPLSEKDRYGLYMPVGICRACGLVQASPRMTQKSYNHFYNHFRRLYIGTETPTEVYFQQRYKAGKITFDYLSEHTEVRGKRVLEVGCGSGAILKYLFDNGASVKGIDLSPEYLDFGQAKYKLDLTNTNLFDLPGNKEFDIIIYSDVLEHILNPKAHLKKIKTLLKDDGLLYIKVPGVKNSFRPYVADFLKSVQNAHVYYFTLTSLKNLMGICGFEIASGSEEIRSLWQVSTNMKTQQTNDYTACMTYLKKLEKRIFSRAALPLAAWTVGKVRNLLTK